MSIAPCVCVCVCVCVFVCVCVCVSELPQAGWPVRACNAMNAYVLGWPEPSIHRYIHCRYGIFSREITIHTVVYGAYMGFWPTLHVLCMMCVWYNTTPYRLLCVCVCVCVCVSELPQAGWPVRACSAMHAYVVNDVCMMCVRYNTTTCRLLSLCVCMCVCVCVCVSELPQAGWPVRACNAMHAYVVYDMCMICICCVWYVYDVYDTCMICVWYVYDMCMI